MRVTILEKSFVIRLQFNIRDQQNGIRHQFIRDAHSFPQDLLMAGRGWCAAMLLAKNCTPATRRRTKIDRVFDR
jgi:hypothetical protein